MISTLSHVSAMTDRSWVMRISDSPSLARSSSRRLEDLRLDHDVEGGRRLVADDDGRVAREGHRDHRPLAHPAGQLVRVGAAALLRDADELEELAGPLASAALLDSPRRCSMGSAIWSRTRWTGLRAFIAPWKTMLISRQR